MIEDNDKEGENTTWGKEFKEIGVRLREAREARNLTQSEIGARLRLSESHIRALEQGDDSLFGAGIYARGYVVNYARQVGINPKSLLAGWREEAPKPPLQLAAGEPQSRRVAQGIARWSTYLAGTAVVLLPIFWWASESSVDALMGQDRETIEAARPGNAALSGASSGAPTGDELPAPPAKQAVLAAMTPIGVASNEAPQPADAAETANIKATADQQPLVPAPLAGAPAAEAGRPELVIVLSEDSWVEVRDATDERLEYDLLRAGTKHRYQGEPPFHLLLGNATGVTVRYNGEPFDFSGEVHGDLARFAVGERPQQSM